MLSWFFSATESSVLIGGRTVLLGRDVLAEKVIFSESELFVSITASFAEFDSTSLFISPLTTFVSVAACVAEIERLFEVVVTVVGVVVLLLALLVLVLGRVVVLTDVVVLEIVLAKVLVIDFFDSLIVRDDESECVVKGLLEVVIIVVLVLLILFVLELVVELLIVPLAISNATDCSVVVDREFG